MAGELRKTGIPFVGDLPWGTRFCYFYSYMSFKYSCTNRTAIAPSPTAEATRFAEPDRTSPAAKTPGRLVSSRKGWRLAVQ